MLVVILIADLWLFNALIQNPEDFFWWKLIFTPVLLVVAIAIARKGYTTAFRLTIGNNQLTYRYLLSAKKTHNITEVSSWHEEVVKNKKLEYKRLTVILSNGRVLQLSNQENSNYQKVIDYLRKRVKMKKA